MLDDSPQIWPGVVGFILAAPCGFIATVLVAYNLGDRFGDQLSRYTIVPIIFLVAFLAAAAALAFAGVRFALARRIFLAGVMFGLAAGTLLFAGAIALMATNTGHGVVSQLPGNLPPPTVNEI